MYVDVFLYLDGKNKITCPVSSVISEGSDQLENSPVCIKGFSFSFMCSITNRGLTLIDTQNA